GRARRHAGFLRPGHHRVRPDAAVPAAAGVTAGGGLDRPAQRRRRTGRPPCPRPSTASALGGRDLGLLVRASSGSSGATRRATAATSWKGPWIPGCARTGTPLSWPADEPRLLAVQHPAVDGTAARNPLPTEAPGPVFGSRRIHVPVRERLGR